MGGPNTGHDQAMLFHERHIPLIREGEKTETRRTWATPQAKVGNTYAATTEMFVSNDEADCWIRVTDMKRERLRAMTTGDARAEGYETVDEFKQAWEEINDEEWDPDQQVTVVVFEYVGEEQPDDD